MIVENKNPIHFIECKTAEKEVSPALRYLEVRFPSVTST